MTVFFVQYGIDLGGKSGRENGRYKIYLRELRLRREKEEIKAKENNQSLRCLKFSMLLSILVLTLSHQKKKTHESFYSISFFF